MLECVARSSDPHIGLTVAQTIQISDLGALGHAVTAAPTVGDGLRLLAQYLYVFAHANVLRLDIGKSLFVLGYHLTDIHLAVHQQDTEMSIGIAAAAIREISGREVNPIVVEFEHARPHYHEELATHFGCEVLYDRATNGLQYPIRVLDLPTTSADASLLQALEFYLADRLKLRAEDEDLLAKVHHLIATSLSEGVPDIDVVAAALGLSRRTLQRRLSDADEVFSDLVDRVRREIATDYVSHSNHSLIDIALMLGYQEASSFSRAFKRWTGVSPQKMRER